MRNTEKFLIARMLPEAVLTHTNDYYRVTIIKNMTNNPLMVILSILFCMDASLMPGTVQQIAIRDISATLL